MAVSRSMLTWFRSTFAFSMSRQSWEERAVLTLIVGALFGLLFFAAKWDLSTQVALWTGFFVLIAVFIRLARFKLLGPVLAYDMIRAARRPRYFILRTLYAGLLFLFLLQFAIGALIDTGVTSRQQLSTLAIGYFQMFSLVQLIVTVVLTPAYVAGAIAEEKDRKTMDYLLATDLYNREIVLSKLLARLANLGLLLITGLPILSILQFLGGVDPNLVLTSFAISGLTMLGIGSVSILASVYFKKPRDAIAISYLFLVAFFGITTTTYVMSMARAGGVFAFFDYQLWPATFFGIPLEIPGYGIPTLTDIVAFINTGNVVAVVIRVAQASFTGGLATTLPTILQEYAIFHGIFSLLCITRAIVMLRTLSLAQAGGGQTSKAQWHHKFRPLVGELPMMWKEFHVEGSIKMNWATFIVMAMLMGLTLISCPIVWIIIYEFFPVGGRFGFHELPEAMNVWCRGAGTGIAFLTLLGVAVRAANSISVERDRDTFDALVASPLSAHQILGAKFLGSLASVRTAWFWMGMIYGLALLCGGLNLFAIPLVIFAWAIYACFFAILGLWFSLVCKTTLRSTVYTILWSIALSGGHWLLTMFIGCFYTLLLSFRSHNDEFLEYIVKFQAGHTPPWVLGTMAYSGLEFREGDRYFTENFAFCLLGLFLWGMACLVLWFVFLVPYFRQMTGRDQSSMDEE